MPCVSPLRFSLIAARGRGYSIANIRALILSNTCFTVISQADPYRGASHSHRIPPMWG